MSETRQVVLNLPLCSGCGACHELAPEIFGWDEAEERPVLLQDEAPVEVLRKIMSYCPEDAIEAED